MLDKEGNTDSNSVAVIDNVAVHVKRKHETETDQENNELLVMQPPVGDRKSQEELDKEEELGLITSTTYQLKKKICLSRFKSLNGIRTQCMANLTERFYLENGFNYLNFNKFLLSVNGQSGRDLNDHDDNEDYDDKNKDEIVDLSSVKITEQTNQVMF